jgi:membrane protein implicated in regulation of membrane protease activity
MRLQGPSSLAGFPRAISTPCDDVRRAQVARDPPAGRRAISRQTSTGPRSRAALVAGLRREPVPRSAAQIALARLCVGAHSRGVSSPEAPALNHVYLGAVAFGLTLLLASLVLGGKDTDHAGHDGDAGELGLGWAPVTSLRFWVFLLTFGGGAGLALTALGSSSAIAAGGALGVGWASGALAVVAIRSLTRHSVSSELRAAELIGQTGTLVLPLGPGRPGKVRVDVKGRTEDYVANLVDDGELPSGAAVLIVAEGEHGSLLVTRAEM